MKSWLYPGHAEKLLRKLWDPKPFFETWPRVELPDQNVLRELLDVCYHASFLTEEGRPITFRVALVNKSASIKPEGASETHPVTRYMLATPRPFSVAELRRLAPVADPRRVLLAVEPARTDGRVQLQIYGLIDIGMSLWEMARHERASGFSSPEALIVSSTRPGELSIARADRPVLRLRDGQIVTPAESVLFEGPVSDFFAPANGVFMRNACELADRRLQDERNNDDLYTSYFSFVELLLLYTADMRHGGTIIFVPDEIDGSDPRLLNRVNVKYSMPSARPREALVLMMAARLRSFAAFFRSLKEKTLDKARRSALHDLDREQEQATDAARDAARFLASLTAVDGALVLTDTLRVLGFGAEVIASAPQTEVVHVANDAAGTKSAAVSISAFGTRHRSAFRFCSTMDTSVAFVLSQDGGMKAVRQVGPKLLMWPYFKIGFTTALP